MTNPLKRPLSFAFLASLLALVALPIAGGATAAGASTPSAAGAHDVAFNPTTVGDILGPEPYQFINPNANPTVTGFAIGGADPDDFTEYDDCTSVAPGGQCVVDVYFVPGELGREDGHADPPQRHH